MAGGHADGGPWSIAQRQSPAPQLEPHTTKQQQPNVIISILTAHHCWTGQEYMVYDTHQNSGAQGVLCTPPPLADGVGIRWRSSCTAKHQNWSPGAAEPRTRAPNQNYLNSLSTLSYFSYSNKFRISTFYIWLWNCVIQLHARRGNELQQRAAIKWSDIKIQNRWQESSIENCMCTTWFCTNPPIKLFFFFRININNAHIQIWIQIVQWVVWQAASWLAEYLKGSSMLSALNKKDFPQK